MNLSIVTGCYNHAKTLPKLLHTLTEQREYFIEWLICDDGSDDPNTIKLLKEYATLPTVQVFRQEHQGMRLAKSLNNGLRKAKGDICFVLMGDTYLDKTTLRSLKDAYVRDTAGSAIRRNVNQDGSHHSWDWRFDENLIGKTLFLDRPNSFRHLTGNSMIAMTHQLKEVGYWPETYEGYGFDDWCVFLRLSRLGVPLVAYNEVIVNHFYHEEKLDENPINKILLEREMHDYPPDSTLFEGI